MERNPNSLFIQRQIAENIAKLREEINSLSLGGSGVGVTDGDKGDITVSGSGNVWTIDSQAVTLSKIQNIGANKLLGRTNASSGIIQEITLGAGLNLTGTVLSATASGVGSVSNYYNTIYIDQSHGSGDTYGILSGAVNGSNTSFTVSQGQYATGLLKVYLNGQLQYQGSDSDWVETTPASGIFTFNTAPVSGDQITVEYQKTAVASEQELLSRIREIELWLQLESRNCFIEYTYSGGDLTNKDIWNNSGKTEKYYSIVYNYSSGDLSSIDITRESDSFTYSKTFAYSAGDLVSITIS